MFRLTRVTDKPILCPIPGNQWEAAAVFNCGITYRNGLVHMLYRSADRDFEVLKHDHPVESLKFKSAIGYAVSSDGVNFKRLDKPVLSGDVLGEEWGCEDPRVSKLGGRFYMLYTGFGGQHWENHRIRLASSPNLIEWKRHGVVLDEPNKDAALLEDKIDGEYVLFHRRVPDIWVAFSKDLQTWEDHQIILSPIANTWESSKVGIAGQPFLMKDGYVMLYHAVDQDKVYRLGAALLDKNDPTKVLARLDQPILQPELDWEINGLVPNVVFSCGQAIIGEELFVYYGGADTVIGVAKAALSHIRF